MANRWIARWVRAHRSGWAAAFIVLAFIGPIPAATSPLTAADSLSGTWQLSRTCLSGCTGTTTLTETVHPYRGPIFMATGTAPMVLYRIGKRKVLVHAATSSSLLTIRTPGQVMQGKGVSQDGSAFSVIWRCVSAVGTGAGRDALHPAAMPGARGIC